MKMKRLAVCALASAMLFAGSVTNISAFNLGSILGGVVKVGGIGFLVDKYGESINSAINSVMMKEGAGTNYATKVVPIVSIGNSGYIGAAQVIGDADQVAKVEAVGQLEISWTTSCSESRGSFQWTARTLLRSAVFRALAFPLSLMSEYNGGIDL